MSLLHALDPGASPSRPGCEARGCRSTSTTSVRAYLGRPHPTTLRVCERHRRDLEIAGDLENPVICCYPPCGRTRAPSSRLCAEHDAIIVAAKINIPRKGVISAETLVAIRKAVEAADLQKASTAAVASARPRMEEPAPDYLGACWEHLRDHVAGGTRIDMAVGEVVDLLKQTRKNLARREKDWESAVQIAELRGDEVRAASAALTALGVPMIQADPAEPQYDLVARIKRLAMRPTVQPEPVPADVLQPEAIGGQKLAADLIMEALNGRLAEMPAGVELSLQLALTGVVGLLASERGAVAQRDALAATVAAITATLDELRAPDGAQQPDGTIDTSEATRIRLLLAYWSDAIRSVLPGNAERSTGERAEPLAGLLRDIRAGLEAAQKAAQPTPTVQADPLRVQATTVDGLRVAVEWALDEAKAPQAASLTDRIAALAKQRDEMREDLRKLRAHIADSESSLVEQVDQLKQQEAKLLKGIDSIAEALNVGPPNEFDIQAGTPPGIVAQIVRSRSQALQEERARRVALAEELEALKVAAPTDPLSPAVDALVAWLDLQTGAALLEQMIRAVARRTVPPEAAIRALRSEEEMARIILSTPEPFGVPF